MLCYAFIALQGNSNKDCVANVKNVEISDELGKNLSRWQIYPSTKSPGENGKMWEML